MNIAKEYSPFGKVYFGLIVALITLGPFYTFWNYGGQGFDLPFNHAAFTLLGLIIGSGFWFIHKSQSIVVPHHFYWVPIGLALMIVPSLFSPINSESLIERSIMIFLCVLLYLSIFQFNLSEQDKTTLISILLIGVCLQMALGFVQYMHIPIENYYLKVFIQDNLKSIRGSFQQPNAYASFIATGYACCLYLISKKTNLIRDGFIYSLIFSISMLMYWVNSRTGLLAILCLTLLSFIVIERNKALKITLAFVLGIFIAIYSPTLFLHTGTAPVAEIKQTTIRLDIYYYTLLASLESPCLGHGIGKYPAGIHHFILENPSNSLLELIANQHLNHPHNELLLWVYEAGIVGLIGISLLIAYVTTQTRFIFTNLMLILPIGLHALTEYPLHYSFYHLFIFIGLCALIHNKELKKVNWDNKISKLLSLFVPLSCLLFAVSASITVYQINQAILGKHEYTLSLMKPLNPIAGKNKREQIYFETLYKVGMATDNKDMVLEYYQWASSKFEETPTTEILDKLTKVSSYLELVPKSKN